MSERHSIPFTKMHGAGNDFVLLDGIREALPPIADSLPGFAPADGYVEDPLRMIGLEQIDRAERKVVRDAARAEKKATKNG